MKIPDFFIILFTLSIATTGLVLAFQGEQGNYVQAETPTGSYRFSLDEDREIVLEGDLGEYRLEIADGAIRATESACPAQICVHRGEVYREGDSIICVPNRIIVKVLGNLEEVDAVTE